MLDLHMAAEAFRKKGYVARAMDGGWLTGGILQPPEGGEVSSNIRVVDDNFQIWPQLPEGYQAIIYKTGETFLGSLEDCVGWVLLNMPPPLVFEEPERPKGGGSVEY
jgi:hypothetical protein